MLSVSFVKQLLLFEYLLVVDNKGDGRHVSEQSNESVHCIVML